MKKTDTSKIEEYKTLLKKPFWELYEAFFFFSGITDLKFRYRLDPSLVKFYGINSIGLWPNLDFEGDRDIFISKPFQELFKAIVGDEIDAHAIKLQHFSRSYKGYDNDAYLVKPMEITFLAVSQGIILPIELQIAANLHQIPRRTRISKTEEKRIKRLITAQVFWYKFPGENISQICQKIDSVKKKRGFDFVHGSANRLRDVVKQARPHPKKGFSCISEVMDQKGEKFRFDFYYLKILLDMMGLLYPKIKIKERLSHPLLKPYTDVINKEFFMFAVRRDLSYEEIGEAIEEIEEAMNESEL